MSSSGDHAVPQPRDEYCSQCGTRIPTYGSFCPLCGAPRPSFQTPQGTPGPGDVYFVRAPYKRPPQWRTVFKTILAFGMITFVVQLLLGLATLIYGTTVVLPEIVHASYTLYVIVPVLVGIGTLSGEVLAAYYLAVVAAIVASAVWLFISSVAKYRKELEGKAESRDHSAIFDLCGLLFAVLFLNVVVVLLVSALWGEPEAPTEESETWELLFLLANASVWEELVVRVLMIGIPLMLIDAYRNALQPKKTRYLFGGGIGLGWVEVILILASSAMFGLGHYEGWGAWKIFPSAVAGVAFGYMFLRHGLASAIMLHFGFDYLYMPTEVFAGDEQLGVLVLLGVAVLFWLAMGVAFFAYYVMRMAEFVTKRKYWEPAPPAPTPYYYVRPQPYVVQGGFYESLPQREEGPRMSEDPYPSAPYPGSTGFFVCAKCGFTQARWVDGSFQCLRCGFRT